MEIISRFKKYSVDFAVDLTGLVEAATDKRSFFIIDRKVYDLHRAAFPEFPAGHYYLLDAEEEKKTIETALDICDQMTHLSARRNSHLLSIGGGITQDIAGFVAANLYRGIQWTCYPSTLLSAGDSCIGGKSSLNYHGYKNLLGTFCPPDDIRIYSPFFQTLSLQDYCSGLGEVVKFNVIDGERGLSRIENDMEAILGHDYEKLEQYIRFSLNFKKRFIEEDEFDHGSRILLNYAHTFGHALETTSCYAVPHGSAVAMGMTIANQISVQRGYILAEYAERIEKLCRKILRNIRWQTDWFAPIPFMRAIRQDKKQTDDHITAVLLQSANELKIVRDLREQEIWQAIHSVLSRSGGERSGGN